MFCKNCGQQLVEDSKFCHKCGTPAVVNDTENENSRKTVYDGEIHKCPNCGEVLDSFTKNCPQCGFELRGAKAVSSVSELAMKLEQIEKQRDKKKSSIFTQSTAMSKTDEQKINLIKNFPIPNTKEDIMEFMILASSNIFSDVDNKTLAEKELSKAWNAKFEQAYNKAKILFEGDLDFNKIQGIHERKSKKLKSKEREPAIICAIVYGVLFALFGLIFTVNISLGKKDAENIKNSEQQLEYILSEVYDAIADENYTLARAKATSLVFSGSTTSKGEQAAEKWDKTRKEILTIIDKAEFGESYIQTEEYESTVETVEEDIEQETTTAGGFIAGFKEGFEKALEDKD